jgi:hypothetical protein
MKIGVIIKLSSGMKIELTEAEILELRNHLNVIYGTTNVRSYQTSLQIGPVPLYYGAGC